MVRLLPKRRRDPKIKPTSVSPRSAQRPSRQAAERNRRCSKLLRFESTDLDVVKGSHEVGSDLSRVLLGDRVWGILLPRFENVIPVCRRPLPRHGIGTAQRPWREPPTSTGWSRSIKGAHLIETAIHLPNQAETDYRDRPRKRPFLEFGWFWPGEKCRLSPSCPRDRSSSEPVAEDRFPRCL